MALNLKKTIKPRSGGSKSTTVGGLGSFVPSGVEKPAGTKGGSAAGMIDKAKPTNSPGGGSKGGGGSKKTRMRPKGRMNY